VSETVTPIRKGIDPGDVIKAQMLDAVGECYQHMQNCNADQPVAMLVTLVSEKGGASTFWYVTDKCEHQTSLYLARALQVAQIDLHEHQRKLSEG
jgi:hypothetical protein